LLQHVPLAVLDHIRLSETTALNFDLNLCCMLRCFFLPPDFKPIRFLSLILSVPIAAGQSVYGYAYMDVNAHFHFIPVNVHVHFESLNIIYFLLGSLLTSEICLLTILFLIY
jgi:hypothetical protein